MRIFIGNQFNVYGMMRAITPGANIVIRPTLKCNLACSYCSAEWPGTSCWVDPAGDRSAAQWIEQFEDEISRRHGRIRQVILGGGEPLLYADIIPLLNYFRHKRILSYIFSNLMLRTIVDMDASWRLWVKFKATFHIDSYNVYGPEAGTMFLENLTAYRRKFIVECQELPATWKHRNRLVQDSVSRPWNVKEKAVLRLRDTYGPDGKYYPRDVGPNVEKYKQWRLECAGQISNPLRAKMLAGRRECGNKG